MEEATRRELARRTERWFIRRGLPHFIHDYNAREDILTRAAPFLSLVFIFNVWGAFAENRRGWSEVLPVGGAVLILIAVALALNRLRHRRLLQLPDRVGLPEVLVFVFVPALIPLIFSDQRWTDALWSVGTNVAILIVTYWVVSFGILPMSRWAIGRAGSMLTNIANLMVRALPLLLLFATFLFLNAEIWEVSHDMTTATFWAVALLLFFVGSLFLLLRIPRELARVADFSSWDDVWNLCEEGELDLPIGRDQLAGRPDPPRLSRRDWINVSLVFYTSQGIQVFLVAVVIAIFYIVFGILTVPPATVDVWVPEGHTPLLLPGWVPDTSLTAELNHWLESHVSTELFKVTGFIAAFSGLQFLVAAVTDSTYRSEFFEGIVQEIREALAVRAVYEATLVDRVPETAA